MQANKKNSEEYIERITDVLIFHSTRERTFQDWLNATQKKDNEETLSYDLMFSQGLLSITGLKYVAMSEGKTKHTSLTSGENNHKIIFVTAEGYSLLNSFNFNKRSIEINQEVKKLGTYTLFISATALLLSFISILITLLK